MGHYSFKPGRVTSLGGLILMVLFVNLGQWQLRRADEKTALMEVREQKSSEAPLQGSAIESLTEADRYRRIVLRGTYDTEHQFLLDNQIMDAQVGYQVLTPLKVEGRSAYVLVNRGWTPLGGSREIMPDVSIQQARVEFTGLIDRFPAVGLKLAGGEIPSPGWPARVQRLEVDALAKRLGYPLPSYQIILDESAPEGYRRDWTPPNLAPEKSRAYALQWFLFAALTFVLWLWHGFKLRPEQP